MFEMRKTYSFVLLLLIVTSWEIFCRVSDVSALVIPPPSAVGLVLWDGLTEGYLWVHIWVTSLEMAFGLIIGCSFGFLSGLLLGENKFLRDLQMPQKIAFKTDSAVVTS